MTPFNGVLGIISGARMMVCGARGRRKVWGPHRRDVSSRRYIVFGVAHV
jgi:hypothetical protein